MKDNSFEAKVKLTFANNPALKQASFTADGKAFYEETDAKIHTKKLSNKAIVTLTRDQVKGMDFSDSNALQEQLEASAKTAAQKKEVAEDGNEFTDVSGQKPAGSQKPEAGDPTPQPAAAPLAKGSNNTGAGEEKTEDGSRKPEAGSEKADEELEALKAEYEKLAGKAPGHNWKAETIAKKVAELKNPQPAAAPLDKGSNETPASEDNKGKEEQ